MPSPLARKQAVEKKSALIYANKVTPDEEEQAVDPHEHYSLLIPAVPSAVASTGGAFILQEKAVDRIPVYFYKPIANF